MVACLRSHDCGHDSSHCIDGCQRKSQHVSLPDMLAPAAEVENLDSEQEEEERKPQEKMKSGAAAAAAIKAAKEDAAVLKHRRWTRLQRHTSPAPKHDCRFVFCSLARNAHRA